MCVVPLFLNYLLSLSIEEMPLVSNARLFGASRDTEIHVVLSVCHASISDGKRRRSRRKRNYYQKKRRLITPARKRGRKRRNDNKEEEEKQDIYREKKVEEEEEVK